MDFSWAPLEINICIFNSNIIKWSRNNIKYLRENAGIHPQMPQKNSTHLLARHIRNVNVWQRTGESNGGRNKEERVGLDWAHFIKNTNNQQTCSQVQPTKQARERPSKNNPVKWTSSEVCLDTLGKDGSGQRTMDISVKWPIPQQGNRQ